MFGGQQGGGYGGGLPVPPPTPTEAPAAASPDPMAAMMQNPMMQQMMSNPAMMQQSMQMAQQMFGNQMGNGANFPGMFGAPAMLPPPAVPESAGQSPDAPAGTPTTGVDAFARVRFASQLAQLSAMGFCNEAACLSALQQHQGRVDAAIDALLASGDSCA